MRPRAVPDPSPGPGRGRSIRRGALLAALVLVGLAAAGAWLLAGPAGVGVPSPPGAASVPAGPGPSPAPGPPAPEVAPQSGVPAHAYAVLAEIERRGGEPPPGHIGGRPFQNRERRLPRGAYREYDVQPRAGGRDRGPERIVIDEGTGRAYYTRDHYRSFVPMR